MGRAGVDPNAVFVAEAPSDGRSSKPHALAPDLGRVPESLRRHARFVLWRFEWDPSKNRGKGGWAKVPYRADGRGRASTTKEATWATFEAVCAAFERGVHEADGIGWVIGEGVTGGDIDACRDPGTGELTPEAAAVVAAMNTYTEISPSSTGLRFFAFGTLPPKGRKRGAFELYDGDGGRYLTLTGHHIEGTPDTIEPRDAELAAIHARHIAPQPRPSSNGEHRRGPATGKGAHLADADVLQRMRSKNAKAAALYDGDLSAHGDDHSAADQALCSHLAWWTDYDAAQVDRLFRASALMRPKWDRPARQGELYGAGTIARAMEGKRPGDGYRPATAPPDLGRPPDDPGPGDDDVPPDVRASTIADSPPERAVWDGPDPLPFPLNTRLAPSLPDDLLPEPLRAWAHDAAQRASVPVDSFVPGLLVTLAATVGNRWRIRPKQHDPWTVVPSLWGALVQPPGQMKSYVLGATTRFLRDIELEERDAYERDRIADEVDAELRDAQVSNLQDELKNLMKKKATSVDIGRVRAELIDAKAAAQAQRNAPPTLMVHDTTTETLLELLRDNPHGLLLVRDELHGWYSSLHKQGREGDRAFYLEAHDGDRRYSQHRIKRGHTEAPVVTLSILGGIQPARLLTIQQGAIGGDEADGLLQRFQVLVWPDRMPPYQLDDREPEHDLEGRVADAYRALYRLDPTRHGYPDGEPGVTRFDPDAQRMFYAWLEELERDIRAPETQSKPAWASYLGKTRSLMPTLALLLHLLDLVTDRADGVSVTPEATDRAARLTDYLAGHAAKLYAPELDREVFAARLIAEKIADGAMKNGDTVREVYNAGWAGLGREEVEAGLAYLDRLGWVRVDRVTTGKGGRPRVVVRLHPNAQALADAVAT